jgi:SAM-dependent methyltransferase
MKLSIITPTHDTTWIDQTWASIKQQDHMDFEWVVSVNDKDGSRERIMERIGTVARIVDGDPRVRITSDYGQFLGVGARKNYAFHLGTGEALIELDHDDLLTPGALTEIATAFREPEIGFVYSDFADFDGTVAPTQQGNVTYRHPAVRPGWIQSGFQFYMEQIEGVRPGVYECVRAPEATAQSVSLVYAAPNHVRCWRRSMYEALNGHNALFKLCDDHELVLRTFLATKMKRIAKPLYLYRVSGQNTWSQSLDEIRRITYELQDKHLEQLVLRECELLGLPAFDLGGAIDGRFGWKTVDTAEGAALEGTKVDVEADLMQKWPWEDNSVGAFRAHDFLEHLPDKLHTMREIHRCLRPGGWLLSMTPSTDGRGAFQDPTHVSYWNENSFWYWTRFQARYIHNTQHRFAEIQLTSLFQSEWHRQNSLPYVKASLVALKEVAKPVTVEMEHKTAAPLIDKYGRCICAEHLKPHALHAPADAPPPERRPLADAPPATDHPAFADVKVIHDSAVKGSRKKRR